MTAPADPRDAAAGVPDPRAWRRAVVVLFAVAAGTNVPTPLLLLYRDRLELSPDALAAVFGVYAAGLVPALFVAGPLSDRVGRRPVVLPFVVLAGLSSLVFVAAADSLPLLFAARWLQGVVSGVVFSVGSAWVAELSAAAGAGAAGRRAAVAMTAGFSIGPLVSGVLGQYAPAPTVLPYLLHVALVGGGLVAALRLPETVRVVRGSPRPAGGVVRPGDRWSVVTVVAPLAVCVYAFPSVVVAGVPLLLDTDAPPVLLTGLLAGVTLGAGALAAPLQQRLGRWTATTAAASGAAGFALAGVSASAGDPVGLFVAAVLLGAGGGAALAAGIALVATLARPARLGTLSAVFYGCAYTGFSGPYLYAVAAQASDVALPLLVAAVAAAVLAVRLAVLARVSP
jgi:MFS family permease